MNECWEYYLTMFSSPSQGGGYHQQQIPPFARPSSGDGYGNGSHYQQPHGSRMPHSSHSATSSIGSMSGSNRVRKEAPAVLDDKTIAPPPKRPDTLTNMTKDALSHLPDFNQIKHSGDCLARLSLKSMVIKKWRQSFWIAFGNHTILFFRSRSDFEEWVSNPYLSPLERDELIKLNIDFKNHVRMENVLGYKMSKITSKRYRGDGYMNQFKVDKWYTYGPSVSAAIGSKNEIEVRNIRRIMTAMMALYPQNVKVDEDEIYDDGSASGSGISRYSAGSGASSRSVKSAASAPTHDLLSFDAVPEQKKEYNLAPKQQQHQPQQYQQQQQQHQQQQFATTTQGQYAATVTPPRHMANPQQTYQYDLGRPVTQPHPSYSNSQQRGGAYGR